MSELDELNHIWDEVTDGAEKTTESQTGLDSRRDISEFGERIRGTIREMRERYDIRSSLTDDQLAQLVRGYFGGKSDKEIARSLGDGSLDKTVSRARIRLHLIREEDTDTKVSLDALMECLEGGDSATTCGERFGIAKSTANRYRRVVRAKRQADAIDHAYRRQFRQYCDEKPISDIDATTDDGLEDAVADAGADNPALGG